MVVPNPHFAESRLKKLMEEVEQKQFEYIECLIDFRLTGNGHEYCRIEVTIPFIPLKKVVDRILESYKKEKYGIIFIQDKNGLRFAIHPS